MPPSLQDQLNPAESEAERERKAGGRSLAADAAPGTSSGSRDNSGRELAERRRSRSYRVRKGLPPLARWVSWHRLPPLALEPAPPAAAGPPWLDRGVGVLKRKPGGPNRARDSLENFFVHIYT